MFNCIDYDHSGEIGYKEFCLLNTDKTNIFAHIEEIKRTELTRIANEKKENLRGKFDYVMNLRKSVDSSTIKQVTDDDLSYQGSNLARQSINSVTRESDIYRQIKHKNMDKPKPYAVLDNANEAERPVLPKKI